MTISSETRVTVPAIGNGITTNLPFTFKVFAAADLLVVQTNTSGVESTKVLTTDYTVSLNADQNVSPGGSITMLVAPPTNYLTTITSAVANLQPTQVSNAGAFFPRVVNDSLDRVTILVQQVLNRVNRSLKIPLSDGTSITTELPTKTLRANKAIVFDVNGNVGVSTDNYVNQAANAAASASAAATSATNASNSATAAATSATNASNSATSAATQATNASNSATAAATSATNASNSATAAAGSATTASTQATNASNSATAAAASALQAASTFTATSTTSNTISVASGKNFTTQTNKNFQANQYILISDQSNAANWMFGQVTSYNNGTGALVFDSQVISGTGTLTAWNIAISGVRGPTGTGDVTSNTATSVDGENVLFNGTTGKQIKRSTLTATVVKSTSGVLSAATAGTDYYNPGGTDVAVSDGGTGVSSLTAYAPLFGGTTGTGAVQSGTVGTATQVLTSNGPGALPTFQAAAGKLVAHTYSRMTTYTSASSVTAIPQDDTIPQSNEGYQFHSQSHTPASSTNILLIRAYFVGGEVSNTANGNFQTIWKDADANCLAITQSGDANASIPAIGMTCEHIMVAGTTSAITFRSNASLDAGTTIDINGRAGARKYGGISACFIEILEFTP